ncbi:MAG TPA: quinol:electron acceptor oxidoreductase subunit ActD [Planctomycetota bacterium]|nr:quinol:electron acceptor oxidoreductase subunit ActD [Planctomycetota bacterium]
MANTSVYALFPTISGLESAVTSLRSAGFRNTDISVLCQFNEGSKDLGVKNATKVPEGATTGGVTGAVIGGALGWLAGIGALAIPGAGPFIAAGPIMGLLAGMGGGGAAGGVVGGLIGLGMPEYEAKRFAGRVTKNGALLSVHCDDSKWVERAKDLLKKSGAEEIYSGSEASADFDESKKPRARAAMAAGK